MHVRSATGYPASYTSRRVPRFVFPPTGKIQLNAWVWATLSRRVHIAVQASTNVKTTGGDTALHWACSADGGSDATDQDGLEERCLRVYEALRVEPELLLFLCLPPSSHEHSKSVKNFTRADRATKLGL